MLIRLLFICLIASHVIIFNCATHISCSLDYIRLSTYHVVQKNNTILKINLSSSSSTISMLWKKKSDALCAIAKWDVWLQTALCHQTTSMASRSIDFVGLSSFVSSSAAYIPDSMLRSSVPHAVGPRRISSKHSLHPGNVLGRWSRGVVIGVVFLFSTRP